MDKDLSLQKGAFADYLVRVSARARQVRLQVSPGKGLIVVVPRHFEPARIPLLLEKKREWIEGHLRRFAALSGARETASADILPDVIELPSLGEFWQICYNQTHTASVGTFSEAPGVLEVYGAVHNKPACRQALINWLRLRTREQLCSLLSSLAAEHGFTFRESVVRGQKTRWGSCSSNKTISLSYKLLFLERDWVRCVLLHELCHTVFMDHSANFRRLLNRLEPRCPQIDKEMREAWRLVPAWADNS